MKNREGKEEPWKRGKANLKKDERVANKGERETLEQKSQKLASLAFEIFSEGLSFSTLLVISPFLF